MIATLDSRARASVRERIARLRLRACDHVGARPVVDGAPTVRNYGWMFIGDDFHLAARPVRSQIVSAPTGPLTIGERVTVGHGAAIAAHHAISIGDDVTIGPFVLLMDTNFHSVTDHSKPGSARAIVIERDVHVGSRVTILPGAYIERGAHIAAGSVVAGFVPAGACVSGVPARRPLRPRLGELPTTSVPALVRDVFGLAAPPRLDETTRDIPGWGALGALTLGLTLEETFGVPIDPEHLGAAARIDDIVAVVTAARLQLT